MNWLKEIEERAEKATPGRVDVGHWVDGFYQVLVEGSAHPSRAEFTNEDDATLYLHNRTDIPRLIACVREMEAALRFYADKDLYVWVDVPLARVLAVRAEQPWEKARDVLKRYGEGKK